MAYFSATGITKALAEYAAEVMEADIYEIMPQEPYTDADLDYGGAELVPARKISTLLRHLT